MLFSYCCIYSSLMALLRWEELKLDAFESELLYPVTAFLIFMMAGLEVMHIFWTYFITEAVALAKFKKTTDHSYHD